MAGIAGTHCSRFSEANIATSVEVSMNADLPHFWFDIVGVNDKEVTMRDKGEQVTLHIKRNRTGEYVEYPMVSLYERLFCGGKPTLYRFVPFKGERF